jgi:hypothetical protein
MIGTEREQSKRMIDTIAELQKCNSSDLVVVKQGENNIRYEEMRTD